MEYQEALSIVESRIKEVYDVWFSAKARLEKDMFLTETERGVLLHKEASLKQVYKSNKEAYRGLTGYEWSPK